MTALIDAMSAARRHARTIENEVTQLGSRMYLEAQQPDKIDADAYLLATRRIHDAMMLLLAQAHIIAEVKS